MTKNIFYLLLLITSRLFAQDSTIISKIKEEARLKSSYFLNLIPEGKEKDYGISARSDFSGIKTEEPYQTFYFSCKGQSCLLISANEWRVPLSIDGNYVALVTVQINSKSGLAEAVDFGANLLAQKFQEFEKLHAGEINQHIVIRNTILNRDYITTDSSGSQPFYLINTGLPVKTTISEIEKESLLILNNTGNK